MNRNRLGWLLWWVAIFAIAAEFFAEGRGYVRTEHLGEITDLVLGIALAILFAVQVKKRKFPAAPASLPSLGKFILIGAGIIVASLAWFAFGLFSELPPTVTVLPFLIMLTVGLAIFVGCAGLKFYKMISRGL